MNEPKNMPAIEQIDNLLSGVDRTGDPKIMLMVSPAFYKRMLGDIQSLAMARGVGPWEVSLPELAGVGVHVDDHAKTAIEIEVESSPAAELWGTLSDAAALIADVLSEREEDIPHALRTLARILAVHFHSDPEKARTAMVEYCELARFGNGVEDLGLRG